MPQNTIKLAIYFIYFIFFVIFSVEFFAIQEHQQEKIFKLKKFRIVSGYIAEQSEVDFATASRDYMLLPDCEIALMDTSGRVLRSYRKGTPSAPVLSYRVPAFLSGQKVVAEVST